MLHASDNAPCKIKSIGARQGWGKRGGLRAKGGPRQSFVLKTTVQCLQYVTSCNPQVSQDCLFRNETENSFQVCKQYSLCISRDECNIEHNE